MQQERTINFQTNGLMYKHREAIKSLIDKAPVLADKMSTRLGFTYIELNVACKQKDGVLYTVHLGTNGNVYPKGSSNIFVYVRINDIAGKEDFNSKTHVINTTIQAQEASLPIGSNPNETHLGRFSYHPMFSPYVGVMYVDGIVR